MPATVEKVNTYPKFIKRNSIQMEVKPLRNNPNMSDMPEGSTHWACVIRKDNAEISIPYSMGPAHTKPPTLIDVLDCLASDAAGYDNARSFEEWCGEYGYDTDSRKAEKVYRLCADQAKALRQLLGSVAYDELLWQMERQ